MPLSQVDESMSLNDQDDDKAMLSDEELMQPDNIHSGGKTDIRSGGETNIHSFGETNVHSCEETNIHSGGKTNIHSSKETNTHSRRETNTHSVRETNIHSGAEINIHSVGGTDIHSVGETMLLSENILHDVKDAPHSEKFFSNVSVMSFDVPTSSVIEDVSSNSDSLHESGNQMNWDSLENVSLHIH